jgi:hypothetical protein
MHGFDFPLTRYEIQEILTPYRVVFLLLHSSAFKPRERASISFCTRSPCRQSPGNPSARSTPHVANKRGRAGQQLPLIGRGSLHDRTFRNKVMGPATTAKTDTAEATISN